MYMEGGEYERREKEARKRKGKERNEPARTAQQMQPVMSTITMFIHTQISPIAPIPITYGRTYGRTYRRTDGQTLLQRCEDASNNGKEKEIENWRTIRFGVKVTDFGRKPSEKKKRQSNVDCRKTFLFSVSFPEILSSFLQSSSLGLSFFYYAFHTLYRLLYQIYLSLKAFFPSFILHSIFHAT